MAEKFKFNLDEGKIEKDFIKWEDRDIELLLECTKKYKTEKEYDSVNWESVKSKYEDIRVIFVRNRGEGCTTTFTKDRVTTKLKSIRTNYRKAVDSGRSSGGGRTVAIFWDLCHEIWGSSPVTIDIHSDFGSDSQDVSISNSRIIEVEARPGSSESEQQPISVWRAKRPNRDSMQDFMIHSKHQRREEEPLIQSSYVHTQNRPPPKSDAESSGNSPYHFVETMRIVVEAHTQQQRVWMEMANKREERFFQREERFLQREERFLQREERFLQTEERFMKVCQEEGERNRQHQLKLAELYAGSYIVSQSSTDQSQLDSSNKEQQTSKQG